MAKVGRPVLGHTPKHQAKDESVCPNCELRGFREALGLSQSAMAGMLPGVTVKGPHPAASAYARWETGAPIPPVVLEYLRLRFGRL